MNSKKIFVEQLDSNDCGAACLSMILKYYGSSLSISSIRDIIGTDINGTSFLGILAGSEKLNFQTKLIKIDQDVIFDPFSLPAICHVRNNDGASHFVVLFSNNNKKIVVLDPARGIIKYNVDDFFKIFNGLILLIMPNENFKKEHLDKNKKFLPFIFDLITKNRNVFAFTLISSIIITSLGILASYFNKIVMDNVLPKLDLNKLLFYTLVFSLAILLKGIISLLRQIFVLSLSKKIDFSLILNYFNHVFLLPKSFFSNRKTGDVITRFQDAFVIKNVITNFLTTFLVDALLMIGVGTVLFIYSKELFLLVLLASLLSFFILFIFSKSHKNNNKKLHELNSQLSSSIIDNLKNIDTIKSNVYENQVIKKVFDKYNTSFNASLKLSKNINIQNTLITLISELANLLVISFGVYFLINNRITIGTMFAFISLSSFFIQPINKFVSLQLEIQNAEISYTRLKEVYNTKIEEENQLDLKTIDKITDIEIKNLNFNYGIRPNCLTNINIKIPFGKKIAIVGENGSGKTTLLNLLLKFYEAKEGQILYNKIEIKQISAYSIRNNIGYVPQTTEMFGTTVLENIKIGNSNISNEQIINQLNNTGLFDFINELPFGYDTYLDVNGGSLSGGQKQKLAIARAIIKNPNFIFFDEASSNLDLKSEIEIFNYFFNQKELSMLIIAHKLSTIKNCDYIYFLKNGEIIEEGTHEELLNKNGLYTKMWNLQSGK